MSSYLLENNETLLECKKDAKDKRRLEILEKLKKLKEEEINKKDEIYITKLNQCDQEIKALREGIHPEYEERLQQLIEKREQTLEKIRLHKNYKIQCVQKMFDLETQLVEDNYLAEKRGLREQILADLEERRKKINEDFESYDVASDANIESGLRFHPQRRLRTRVKEETEFTRPLVSTRLLENEINEDLAEIVKVVIIVIAII
ncbi:6581_t:CDS:2 [Entrophospora sp. SA101]|nr:6581_t:CDS:2 [Entrophospora sp. SA101]CAJ0823941.1 15371_t:CDS:2 [Entrophospora sp. SA101]